MQCALVGAAGRGAIAAGMARDGSDHKLWDALVALQVNVREYVQAYAGDSPAVPQVQASAKCTSTSTAGSVIATDAQT